jgi:hypothetical protein
MFSNKGLGLGTRERIMCKQSFHATTMQRN